MTRRTRLNPFWVTPKGTAGYLSDESEARYRAKHPQRGLVPRFIEREVRMEAPVGDIGPGWTIKVDKVGGKDVFHLYYKGKQTTKYAMDMTKAALLTRVLDPETMKRKSRSAKGNPYATYASDVNLPGLKARRGDEFHYPAARPEKYGPAGVVAAQEVAPGFSIHLGYRVGKGKRSKVFKLFFHGEDTGRSATSPERAAELSFLLDPSDTGFKRIQTGKLRARFNPSPYRVYYSEQKLLGKAPAQINAAWKRKKTAAAAKSKASKNVFEDSLAEIYALASNVFGHNDFIHSSGMVDADKARKTIQIELSSPKWSRWFEPAPLKTFVAGLRKIQARGKKKGLKMTVAVRNPRY